MFLWAVKEEPRDEEEEAKMKAPPRAARKTPGLPKDVSVAELLRELSLTQEEELLFLQLPDTLPGQPPTQDIKPIKTEVQSEDGQMVVVKQEKDRVCSGMGCAEMWGDRSGREAATGARSRGVPPKLNCKNSMCLFLLPIRSLGLCTSTSIICMFTCYIEMLNTYMREQTLPHVPSPSFSSY